MKYVNIFRVLYQQTSGKVRAYGKLSASFAIFSGVRQGCPISPFLINFAIDDILRSALLRLSDVGVELLPGERVYDLEQGSATFFIVRAGQLSSVVEAGHVIKYVNKMFGCIEKTTNIIQEKLNTAPYFTAGIIKDPHFQQTKSELLILLREYKK